MAFASKIMHSNRRLRKVCSEQHLVANAIGVNGAQSANGKINNVDQKIQRCGESEQKLMKNENRCGRASTAQFRSTLLELVEKK